MDLAMQVDRKPNRSLQELLLIVLLVACLLAPLYWQSIDVAFRAPGVPETVANQQVDKSIAFGGSGAGKSVRGLAGIDSTAATWPISNSWPLATGQFAYGADSTPPAIDPTPTIDDLIAALNPHMVSPWFTCRPASEAPLAGNGPMFSLRPASPYGSQWPDLRFTPRAPAPETPNPLAIAVLRHVGTAITIYTRFDIGRWLGEAVSHYWNEGLEGTITTEPAIGPIAPSFPVGDTSSPTAAWGVPDALIDQLARLAEDAYSRRWATQTIIELEAFARLDRANGEATSAQLARITFCAEESLCLADAADDDRLRVALLRAHWSLARRLDRWSATNDIRIAAVTSARVAVRGELGSALHDLADRADVDSLGANLETYERTRDPQLARQIVEAQLALQSSADGLDRNLADAVEQHYRNANVRFAVTKEMLNRFVSEQQNESRPVHDRIAGTPVRGQSETLSESRIRLEPAAGRWQVGIEAGGTVESNTVADGGQARLRSHGTTEFTAQKTVIVDDQGVSMKPTVVSASNVNRLVGVTTDFDWVPIFGSYARGRALDGYRNKRRQAKAEIEFKVADRAADHLDERAGDAVERAKREIEERLTNSLAETGIEITPIELTTTHERLVARLRIAGPGQLAAHTPRPRALSDSLASLQAHESALTNAAVSLGLDGQRFTAPELQARLREKFPEMTVADPPEVRGDTIFHFAERDAVQFHIQNGKLGIALSLVDFERERRHVRNFVVHAFYVPVVNGLSAELVRDGALGIEGSLSSADRARLHSVFKEVFSPDRRLPLVQLNEPVDQRLAGLMITQFVLEDGWLGLAIGPETGGRTAERSRSLR
jgi:hypothetical protein